MEVNSNKFNINKRKDLFKKCLKLRIFAMSIILLDHQNYWKYGLVFGNFS